MAMGVTASKARRVDPSTAHVNTIRKFMMILLNPWKRKRKRKLLIEKGKDHKKHKGNTRAQESNRFAFALVVFPFCAFYGPSPVWRLSRMLCPESTSDLHLKSILKHRIELM
jgi:hypothetical protein